MTSANNKNPLPMATEPSGSSPVLDRGPSLARLKNLAWQAGFFLLVLVNAAVFIRPMELIARLEHWPIYSTLLLVALVFSLGPVIRQLNWRSLVKNPITACVVGWLGVAVLSHPAQLGMRKGIVIGLDLSRCLILYLLVVAMLNTPQRLRTFLYCLAAFGCVQISMVMLQHYHVVDLAALQPGLEELDASVRADLITQSRMYGAGIFHDPNDLGVLAVVAIAVCLYLLTECLSRRSGSRWVWSVIGVAALGLCGRGLMLTQSRGAFVALMVGMATYSVARIGWKKSALLALLVLPVVLFVFAGRQTDISVHRTTSQSRLALWSRSLTLFYHSPLLGIGKGRLVAVTGHVTHNTFLQCFTDTGFFGGMFFLGAFAVALWAIFAQAAAEAKVRRLRPCLLAMLAAWVAGMLTLSRAYVQPTYVILGVATAYLNLTARDAGGTRLRLTGSLALVLVGLSAAYLCGIYIFVHCFHGG